MLQVLPSYHMLQMPTCGLLQVGLGQADAVEHRLRGPLAAGLGDARRVFVHGSKRWAASTRPAPEHAACTEDGCGSCTGSRNGIMPRRLRADDLDRMVTSCVAHRLEVRHAVLVLRNPLLGELAALDLREQLPHRLLGLGGDDARAGRVVAPLGGVADRVAHVVQAAAVHQVDDQLQLVQALEVGDLGLVAGLDERLEAGLHQRARCRRTAPPARRTGRSRFPRRTSSRSRRRGCSRCRAPYASAVARPCPVASWCTASSPGVPPPSLNTSRTRCPGAFGATIVTSTSLRRHDPVEADVEAVREHQHLAGGQVRLDVVLVDLGLVRVGDEDHDDVGPLRPPRRRSAP